MKLIFLSLLTAYFLACGLVYADAAPAAALDNANELQYLQKNNPAHYRIISQMLSELPAIPEADVVSWISHSFHASDVHYEPAFPGTASPRRKLAFTLDGIRYETMMTLTAAGTRRIPPPR